MEYQIGYADVENYWGEKLKSIYIEHHFYQLATTARGVLNIENGAIEKNAMHFYFSTGLFSDPDKWTITITTMNGEVYRTTSSFQCSITAADNGRATIGINGDEQTAYINFPSSSGCSRKLNRVV